MCTYIFINASIQEKKNLLQHPSDFDAWITERIEALVLIQIIILFSKDFQTYVSQLKRMLEIGFDSG